MIQGRAAILGCAPPGWNLPRPGQLALHVDRVILVTTDIHMRRALATFRGAGIDATPAASLDPLTSQSRLQSFIPTADGLRFTRDVAHEYVGLLQYAARGWLRF